jgi:hypothetical protein
MRNFVLGAVAALAGAFACQAAIAAEPAEAKTMKTIFIAKGSADSVTKAINKMHAKMEAEGWTVQTVAVYTEDGDLEGLFVTYVRPGAAAPAAAKP